MLLLRSWRRRKWWKSQLTPVWDWVSLATNSIPPLSLEEEAMHLPRNYRALSLLQAKSEVLDPIWPHSRLIKLVLEPEPALFQKHQLLSVIQVLRRTILFKRCIVKLVNLTELANHCLPEKSLPRWVGRNQTMPWKRAHWFHNLNQCVSQEKEKHLENCRALRSYQASRTKENQVSPRVIRSFISTESINKPDLQRGK